MNDLLYVLTAMLVGVGLLAVAGMFLAAGVILWRQISDNIRQRREADDEIIQLNKRARLKSN